MAGARSLIARGEMLALLQQLALLSSAGVPLDRALERCAARTRDPDLRRRADAAHRRLVDGTSAGEALASTLGGDEARLAMDLASLDEARAPERVFRRAADRLARLHAASQQAATALRYPALLLLLSAGAGAALLVLIGQLELITLATGGGPLLPGFVSGLGPVLYASTAAAALLGACALLATGRLVSEPAARRLAARLPLLAPLSLRAAAAELAGNLAAQFSAGTTPADALRRALHHADHPLLRKRLSPALPALEAGTAPADALAALSHHEVPELLPIELALRAEDPELALDHAERILTEHRPVRSSTLVLLLQLTPALLAIQVLFFLYLNVFKLVDSVG